MPSSLATVLFVDDDASVVEALERSFSLQGHRILTTSSASEALELLLAQHVDVVVSDHEMPAMSGVEFLALVSQRYPSTARVLLTGNATLRVALRAVNEGHICRLLLKPCPSEELMAAVEAAVRYAQLSSATARLLAAARPGGAATGLPRPVAGGNATASCPPGKESSSRLDTVRTTFSHREREVLELLSRGGRTADIAQALFVSQHTIRNHLKAMFRKAGVHSQSELLALAKQGR